MENVMSQNGTKKFKGKAYYHCSNRRGCGSYVEQTDLENQVAEKFKDLQFSEDFIALVIEKTKRIFLERQKTHDGRRQGLVNKKTALLGRLKTAEDKLFNGILDDSSFTRIKSEIDHDIKDIDNGLITLSNQQGIDINVIEEILLLTKNIHRSYTEASFGLKRQYLGFFWDRFEVENGVILNSVPSPLFKELIEAEREYFQKPQPEKTFDYKGSGEGILTNVLLPG